MSDSSKQANRIVILAAVIGGICTVLAALIGLSAPLIERTLDRMSASTLAPTDVPSATPIPTTVSIINTEAEKAAVMNAINLVGTIEAQALFDLDPEPLSKIFSGEALKSEITMLDNLKKNQFYQLSVRHDIRFEEITIANDGLHAEAYVIPIWETRVYSSVTKQCIGYIPPMEVPQRLYLEKTASGWIIYVIAFDNQQMPDWQACP